MSMRARRPGPKAEIGQTQEQIRAGYMRFCEKHGLKKPGRWAARPMAKGAKG